MQGPPMKVAPGRKNDPGDGSSDAGRASEVEDRNESRKGSSRFSVLSRSNSLGRAKNAWKTSMDNGESDHHSIGTTPMGTHENSIYFGLMSSRKDSFSVGDRKTSHEVKPEIQVKVDAALALANHTTLHDAAAFRHEIGQLSTALLSIALMVTLGLLNWQCDESGDNCHVVSNVQTETTKALLSLSSLALVVQLILYQRFWFCIDQLRFNRRTHFFRSPHFTRGLKEAMLCLLHAPPFLGWVMVPGWVLGSQDEEIQLISDKLALFVWLRILVVVRVIRSCSGLYRKRAHIARMCLDRAYPIPNFHMSFVLKSLFQTRPSLFLLQTSAGILVITSHVTYICEREASDTHSNPWDWNFVNTIWFTVVTITTLGYGDMVPTSFSGRLAAFVGVSVGIMYTSFAVAVLTNWLNPSPHQQQAIECLMQHKAMDRERAAVIKYVQALWRYKVLMKKLLRSHTPDQINKHVQPFVEAVLRASLELRRVNRYKTETHHQQTMIDPMVKNIEDQVKAHAEMLKKMEVNLDTLGNSLNSSMSTLTSQLARIEARLERGDAQHQVSFNVGRCEPPLSLPTDGGDLSGRTSVNGSAGSEKVPFRESQESLQEAVDRGDTGSLRRHRTALQTAPPMRLWEAAFRRRKMLENRHFLPTLRVGHGVLQEP